jgi:hypothetical protein
METPKPPEFRQIHQTKISLHRIEQIRQKLGDRQKYFLPARRISNPPECSKSGGQISHLATLAGACINAFPRSRQKICTTNGLGQRSIDRTNHISIVL